MRKDDGNNNAWIAPQIREWIDNGTLSTDSCNHLADIQDVIPSANGCEDCLKTGDSWFHLRLCLECGHVGCCDNSKNKHATRHFHETQHPLIVSYEPGEEWLWCYEDELLLST